MGTLLKQNHKEVANKLKLHLQETTQITNPRIDKLTETSASFDTSWRTRGWGSWASRVGYD